MLSTTVSAVPETSNPFETTLTLESRFNGGATILEPEFIDWIGETLLSVQFPGHTVHLRPHEARDLAAALQSLATFIDEEAGR